MKKYILFLRGINVSGKNMISMKELKSYFEGIGFEDVVTYIQSGNIVFNFQETSHENLKTQIESLILQKFGLQIVAFITQKTALESILENQPFKNIEDTKQIYFTFLERELTKEETQKLTSNQALPDEYVVSQDVIYINCINGYGKTKLTNTFFEQKLKISATTRNWNTLVKMIELG